MVQISAGSRNSACHQNVQTGSEAHSTTYSVGTVGSFPCSKVVWVGNKPIIAIILKIIIPVAFSLQSWV